MFLARIIRRQLRSRGEPSGAKAMKLYLEAAFKPNFESVDLEQARAFVRAPTTPLKLFVSVPSFLQAHPSIDIV